MTVGAALADHAGAWAGTNSFRLLPSEPPSEAPSTAEVSMAAGGSLVVIAYAWAHPTDGAQDGLLVAGAGDEAGSVAGFWGDSWHQSPTPRACAGTADGGVITVGYEYHAGWRWQITVDPTNPETLRLRMHNMVPENAAEGVPAGAYPAMAMDLRRSNA